MDCSLLFHNLIEGLHDLLSSNISPILNPVVFLLSYHTGRGWMMSWLPDNGNNSSPFLFWLSWFGILLSSSIFLLGGVLLWLTIIILLFFLLFLGFFLFFSFFFLGLNFRFLSCSDNFPSSHRMRCKCILPIIPSSLLECFDLIFRWNVANKSFSLVSSIFFQNLW